MSDNLASICICPNSVDWGFCAIQSYGRCDPFTAGYHYAPSSLAGVTMNLLAHVVRLNWHPARFIILARDIYSESNDLKQGFNRQYKAISLVAQAYGFEVIETNQTEIATTLNLADVTYDPPTKPEHVATLIANAAVLAMKAGGRFGRQLLPPGDLSFGPVQRLIEDCTSGRLVDIP